MSLLNLHFGPAASTHHTGAMGSNSSSTRNTHRNEKSFPEESVALKILAAVPVIGFFSSLTCQVKLLGRIRTEIAKETPDHSEVFRLHTQLKHYSYVNIARSLAVVATVVTLVALGIFTGGVGPSIVLGAVGTYMAMNAYGIYRNNQEIGKHIRLWGLDLHRAALSHEPQPLVV